MRACNIYKTKDFYKIITESETEDGFLLSGDPVFLVSIEDNSIDLTNAIFNSLKSSRTNVPTPKREQYPILEKEIMKKIKEKSYTSLYKTSNSASLRLEEGTLKIWPLKFFNPARPGDGLVLVEEDKFEIPDAENNKEEVVKAITEILNRKYS